MSDDIRRTIHNIPYEMVREMELEHPEDVLKAFEGFEYLMMRYESAIREVRTKLEILNKEMEMFAELFDVKE
ncbi:MAG: hypothetical protein IIY76_01965 [Erysipelotrichaceae bacterium]|nr:hypothetical protein [Erysipelotrichaceae bacterium]